MTEHQCGECFRKQAEIERLKAAFKELKECEADNVCEIERLRAALIRLRDCDWVITLPDRMDAVRDIARKALEGKDE